MVGAAVLDLNAALFAMEHGIGGIEFLSGIPGTIGGALAMNAGAYGYDIASTLIEAKAISLEGEIRSFSVEEIGYIYRGKKLGKEWIFVEATFKGVNDTKEEIGKRIAQIQEWRENSQPIRARTGGSTFKNPNGKSSVGGASKLGEEKGSQNNQDQMVTSLTTTVVTKDETVRIGEGAELLSKVSMENKEDAAASYDDSIGSVREREEVEEKLVKPNEKKVNRNDLALHKKAWELIDGAGCRGLRIGGAQVSELHCNFLLNVDNATASDLENLINEIQEKVYKKYKVLLESELIIVGEK